MDSSRDALARIAWTAVRFAQMRYATARSNIPAAPSRHGNIAARSTRTAPGHVSRHASTLRR
jgi:hypothetical protein